MILKCPNRRCQHEAQDASERNGDQHFARQIQVATMTTAISMELSVEDDELTVDPPNEPCGGATERSFFRTASR